MKIKINNVREPQSFKPKELVITIESQREAELWRAFFNACVVAKIELLNKGCHSDKPWTIATDREMIAKLSDEGFTAIENAIKF